MNKTNNVINIIKKIQLLDQDQSCELYLKNISGLIYEMLHVDYVFITYFDPNKPRESYYFFKGNAHNKVIKTKKDCLVKNIMSEEKKIIQVPTNFKGIYPESRLLTYTAISSYVGYPIFSEDNELLFTIELFQKTDMSDIMFIADILPVIARPVFNHIQNSKALSRLDKSNYVLSTTLAKQTKELAALRIEELEQERLASLGRDIAGISHEMKNPLDYVLDHANKSVVFAKNYKKELMRYVDDLDSQTQESLLNSFNDLYESLLVINTHSNRLFDISNAMLEQVDSKCSFKKYNIHDLLTENLQYAYHSSPLCQSEIRFNSTIEIPKDLSEIVLSSDVSSLFLNLFDNAFDSIFEDIQDFPAKPAEIEIIVSRHLDDIEISIRDNGKGMDQNTLNHIGEPFYTTKPKGHGTGIGLAIVNEILTRNSGNMKLNSIPHECTTFELHFPYMQAI